MEMGVTSMNRLLSERAVIEALQNRIGESITDCIKAIPSAEPKTGHWMGIENEEMEIIDYFCSECDMPMQAEEKTAFCSNCGARMIEPQESKNEEV